MVLLLATIGRLALAPCTLFRPGNCWLKPLRSRIAFVPLPCVRRGDGLHDATAWTGTRDPDEVQRDVRRKCDSTGKAESRIWGGSCGGIHDDRGRAQQVGPQRHAGLTQAAVVEPHIIPLGEWDGCAARSLLPVRAGQIPIAVRGVQTRLAACALRANAAATRGRRRKVFMRERGVNLREWKPTPYRRHQLRPPFAGRAAAAGDAPELNRWISNWLRAAVRAMTNSS